jgi:hypothetical protein
MLAHTEKPPLTPAAIAASVAKSSALKVAELRITRLNEQREQIVDKQRALIAGAPGDRDTPEISRPMVELQGQRLEIEAQIGAARRASAKDRDAHGRAVSAALLPIVRAAAARIVALLGELQAEIATSHACWTEAERAGGSVPALPGLAGVAAFELEARRLAEDQ